MNLVNITVVMLLIILAMLPSLKCSFFKPYKIDTNKYYKMPNLNKFDSYDECLGTYYDEAKFCYVKTYIKPDDTSVLYNNIRNFSSMGKQHFRHDKLVRGVCMNKCKEMIDKMGDYSDEYFVPEFPMDTKLNFDFVNFVNVTEYRAKYNKVINKCINIELMDQYNLSGYSSIEYCTQKEIATQIDWLDITFVVVVCTLVLLVIVSFEYDNHLMSVHRQQSKLKKYNQNKFFTAALPTTYQKLMTAFSLRRNWHTLTAETKPERKDLRSFQCIRIWSMFPIVYGHCCWLSIALPMFNTEFLESKYHELKAMLLINGSIIVQTFFFLSGFLNSILLLENIEKKRIKYINVWLMAVSYRLIRCAPVLMFMVMLHATWLYRLDDGPFWDNFVFSERQACREKWWTNILFINNYVRSDLKCMIHSWYISADFQLSALGTALLLLIVHKPKRTKLVLGVSISLSFVIATIHNYVTKMEPVLIYAPETLRNKFYVTTEIDKHFYDYHVPTHLNSGNYLIGLAIGLWYYKYKKANKKHHRKTLFQILWHCSYICYFILIFVGFYFYENNVEKNIFTALLSAFFKHIYGVVIGVSIVGLIFNYGFIIPRIFNHPMYRILGRLSYSVYMGHLSVLLLLLVKAKNMSEINKSTFNAYAIATYGISHLFALFLALGIEIPARVIFNTICNDIINRPKSLKTIDMKVIDRNHVTVPINTIEKC